MFDVCTKTVKLLIVSRGLTTRPPYSKSITPEMVKGMVDLYTNKQLTAKEIAKLYHIDRTTVALKLRLAGITIRVRRDSRNLDYSKFSKNELVDYYITQKKSIGDIAQIYHSNFGTIRKILFYYNVPLRTKQEGNKLGGEQISNGNKPHRHNNKGGIVNRSGYRAVYAPDHPYCNQGGYVFEHRLVMEKKLGRYLLPNEHVHHINGVRHENTEDNLSLLSPNDHSVMNNLCADCSLRKKTILLRKEVEEMRRLVQLRFKAQP
jgi:hypothetical protein